MRAIVQHRYGSPDVLALADLPVPEPGPGEVRVRVRAASIFFGDVKAMRGSPAIIRTATGLRRPKQPIPGIDVAGVVDAIGPGVLERQPGDEVFGWVAGSLAEFVCAPQDHVVLKPGAVTFEEAAAVPETAMTALQGLRDVGRVQPGQRVLVIGASGGVGTFAVQIAKALGATVTAVCSTRNAALVRSIGADDVIDYTREDFLTSRERFDVILQLAGTASPRRLRSLVTPAGTLVLSSGQGRVAGIDRILQATLLNPFVKPRIAVFLARENQADLLAVSDLLESGAVRPVIDRCFPLSASVDAFRYLEAGHTQGKVVITV